MRDKRFLKVKKVNEERLFKSEWELAKFCEKMNQISFATMYDSPASKEGFITEWQTMHDPCTDKDKDLVIAGNFLFKIFRGYFERESGVYEINILAIQRADRICMNDRRKIFAELLEKNKNGGRFRKR
jgi:hypothetical protein